MKKQLYNALCSTFYIGACAFMLCACNGKDGAPGPTGDPGAIGDAGALGPKGKDASTFIKNGTVSGKITGFRKDGITPLNENFQYGYQFSSFDNRAIMKETTTAGMYEFSFTLYDSISFNKRFQLIFEAPLDLSSISVIDAQVIYSKLLDVTKVLEVQARFYTIAGKPTSPFTFTDMSYNQTTGLLTGNYVWQAENKYVDNSYSSSTSTNLPLTVTGQFSIPFQQVSSFRISNDQ
ncbi:MAG: collagen-like protein [Bacteroidota bacterium]